MSARSWKDSLNQTLDHLIRTNHIPRVALLGVGHELRGDDAAGLLVARGLLAHMPPLTEEEELAPVRRPTVLVIEAGSAPENFTGRVRRFHPDLVILVDAADLGAHPGSVRWIDWRDTEGLSASTHTLPIHMLAQYLVTELGCRVALLGIQPAAARLGHAPTLLVQRAIESLVVDLVAIFWLEATPL